MCRTGPSSSCGSEGMYIVMALLGSSGSAGPAWPGCPWCGQGGVEQSTSRFHSGVELGQVSVLSPGHSPVGFGRHWARGQREE